MKNTRSSEGSEAGGPETGASPWSLLQRAVFRSLWIALVVSNIGTWMQSVGAAWARARALGIYLLAFQGVMAAGSFGWGALAEQFGNGTALSVAALALVCTLAASRR